MAINPSFPPTYGVTNAQYASVSTTGSLTGATSPSFTVTSNPNYSSGTTQSITGTLQITPNSNYSPTYTVTPSGTMWVNLAGLPNLPPLPEDWKLAYFMAASMQGLRSAGDKRSSQELALQAYLDAQAMIEVPKRLNQVTSALTTGDVAVAETKESNN